MRESMVIEFHLDGRSGVAPYMQLIQQVRQAMRLGLLTEGDQLPTVKDVVAKVAINPNTVLKAYRELEYEGLVAARPGGRHVRDPDPDRRIAGRARPAPRRAARVARPCTCGRVEPGKHRGPVRDDIPHPGRGAQMIRPVLQAEGLSKRYGRREALSDCTLAIPPGRVVGLVGPNGAGKTTLLHIAVGLLAPTAGRIEVLGRQPASGSAQLARVGFVAQDAPTYAGLSVADHLRVGAHTNPRWDQRLADERIAKLGLDPSQKAGKLSGGQRAQLALTLAIAKRPDLLILDEPVASLDPLARREFLQGLMAFIADHEASVILSSHLVSDLERVCDYLIVLVASRVRVAGEADDLLASHHRLTGARRDLADLPAGTEVIEESHTDRQSTLIVRSTTPLDHLSCTVEQLTLEDLVLAYMSQAPRNPQLALETTP